MSRRLPWGRLLVAAAGAVLVLFIVGPLLRLLFRASPTSLIDAFRDPELGQSILLTLFTATAATAIGALLGVPLA
ncbi:MAG: molybdate ABC transporter permease subunit, partial [Gemmatimonadales bacterium]|nr:molybdate ABC transporter permease subunit [Gemmatimonadales bacterium]